MVKPITIAGVYKLLKSNSTYINIIVASTQKTKLLKILQRLGVQVNGVSDYDAIDAYFRIRINLDNLNIFEAGDHTLRYYTKNYPNDIYTILEHTPILTTLKGQ